MFICSIYDYQDNGRTFESVEEFLKMLDQDFYRATRVSFRKYLFVKGFHKRFIDEIGQMATLVNYDQSVDSMNAFPGKYSTLYFILIIDKNLAHQQLIIILELRIIILRISCLYIVV